MLTDFVEFAGISTLTVKAHDITKIIKDTVFLQRHQCEIDYEIINLIDDCKVLCEKMYITQVMTNLLKNAAESITTAVENSQETLKGKIIITLQKSINENEVIVLVEDNGIGISADIIERICEPYVTTKATGTGLGLSIVKKIIEEHKGEFTIKNRSSGGTVASFGLQIAKNKKHMTKHNNLYGIFFMIVNSFALASLYAINKQLLKGLPSSQATFLYKFVVFICLAIWVLRKGFKGIKTPVLPLHITRGFFSISGSLCFAYGLKHTQLANATALGYTEQLLWAIFGVMFFHEKMTTMKFGAILMIFLAMFLVLFPYIPTVVYDMIVGNPIELTTSGFDYHYLFIIAAAFFWAVNSSIVKVFANKAVKVKYRHFMDCYFKFSLHTQLHFLNGIGIRLMEHFYHIQLLQGRLIGMVLH